MGENRKVLIVDDDLIDVMQAEKYLREADYEVVRLSSPNGALSKIDYEAPEVLLIDIEMDRLDAEDLVATLRRSPHHREMVVIVHADREADELETYCVDHDVNGYYCKSRDASQIPEFLEEFFD